MTYRFETTKRDFSDLAAGKVLYHQPGAPAFPVRLASEVFQRCVEALLAEGKNSPYQLYDPLCGTGYLLTTLGFLHGQKLSKLYASDIDWEILQRAKANLGLLTASGLEKRRVDLEKLYAAYGKLSHREAMRSAANLSEKLPQEIYVDCFQADATKIDHECLKEKEVDIVISDIPYDALTHWKVLAERDDPLSKMLSGLQAYLSPPAIVAIIGDKKTKVPTLTYQRIKTFTLGKRRVTMLMYSEMSA